MRNFFKGLAFALALCAICSVSLVDASPRIKATYLFPYETTQVGDFIEPICEAEVIGESCLPGEKEEVKVDVPYSGTVGYSGEVGYSGIKSFSGATEYSGTVGYSGEVLCTGEVAYKGTTPFTYTTYDISEACIKVAGNLAPVCPEDRWTEYESGKCPSECNYPANAVDCQEKKTWEYYHYVYSHKFKLEFRDNCCKADGNSGNWTCFGINPTAMLNPTDFCYDVYTPSEVTVNVPYSGTAGFEKNVPFKGEVAYSGVAGYKGELEFAGTVGYQGEASYKGTTPYNYLALGAPLFTPGTAVTNCENVGIEQLVTKVCPGETISIRGGGYIWREKPTDVVKSRFVVIHQAPGKGRQNVIVREDRDLADVQDGEFKEERQFTFELPGTYTIRYWVYNKGTPVSMAQTRIIEVPEACEQLPQ